MSTRYIIDIPSNRVIFFTTDDSVNLRAGPEAIVYEDFLPVPNGMTLANAWCWKLYGRTFKLMEDELPVAGAKKEIDVLEENKKEVIKVLSIQINATRKKLDNALSYNPSIINIINNELNLNNNQTPMLKALAKVEGMSVEDYRPIAQERVRSYNNVLVRTEQWYNYYVKKIGSVKNLEELGALRDEIGNRNYNLDLF